MLAVALFGWYANELRAAVAFGAGGGILLGISLALLLGFSRTRIVDAKRGELLVLLIPWLVVPALTTPVVMVLVPEIGVVAAFLEMVSGFTTTGATVFHRLEELPASLLLWRSITQWLGGLATLAAALAILAPRRLGVFDVTEIAIATRARADPSGRGLIPAYPSLGRRLARTALRITPFYVAFTVLILLGYVAAGMSSFDAINHAMTTISTGGFSTRDGGMAALDLWLAEPVALAGMIIGAFSIAFHHRLWKRQFDRAAGDAELRLFLLVLGCAILIPFLLHAAGAQERGTLFSFPMAGKALWDDIFRAVSFLTTTGHNSVLAGTAGEWSGTDSSRVLLLGLVAVGGGVASTAGGIRLRCVAILFAHCLAEIARTGSPKRIRAARRSGRDTEEIRLAWLVAMMFAIAASAGMLVCGLTGMEFGDSMTAAIASLSNAGPIHPLDPELHASGGWRTMPEGAQLASCALMVAGRIGLLAVVALLRPD